MHIRIKVGLANLGEDTFQRHLFQDDEYNYKKMRNDARFKKELAGYLRTFAGRPTPMYYAKTLTKYAGGARIYLKREDLLHCTQDKQRPRAGITCKTYKTRILAETGAGQAWPLQWRVRY